MGIGIGDYPWNAPSGRTTAVDRRRLMVYSNRPFRLSSEDSGYTLYYDSGTYRLSTTEGMMLKSEVSYAQLSGMHKGIPVMVDDIIATPRGGHYDPNYSVGVDPYKTSDDVDKKKLLLLLEV